ncbi:guanine deaminase [Burkholderiaceae bacterium FT117]|uniref:guanine deaminase n=1 Tax=Zeimonas sediminis TaxID=2944268 RepID=UPI00234306BA|nr:guanine deaminase [Zeimonas sediminis]MCM5572235.1 guanine deaminase [Zeimonas sediminis]
MRRAAYRGEIVDFTGDPLRDGEAACRHFADGLLVVGDGRVQELGPFDALAARIGDTPVRDLRGRILVPGFVDAHVHYPQTDIVASPAPGLLDWLERYTFPAERRFADPGHAAEVAGFFLDELLRNGTTTAMVWATVHPVSVDAIMQAARARNMRLIAGKVLMDRNCPADLCETAESGTAETRALIERWHGAGRLGYAVTPRFAPTSTPAQLAACARLLDEHPGVWLQSHLAENADELRWVAGLFPDARSYTDVYDRFGLLRGRSVWAHGIHLDDADRERLAASGATVAFCPTSNLFLGSGLFDAAAADRQGLRYAPATDVGGGTSFSMLRTLAAAHDVMRLQRQALSGLRALWLATHGAAQAIGLDDRIGSFEPGREADFVALDPAATPLLARRTAQAGSLEERLFALTMLGDDRAVAGVWIAGGCMKPPTARGVDGFT